MSNPTRREVLAVAAVTVTLPMLQSALGGMKTARANATLNPAAAAPRGGAAGARPGQAPAEKPGWFATALKPADVKAGEFTAVTGHSIVLTRTDKDVSALTSKCTHQGCDLSKTVKAAQKTVVCGCHGATFNLDGTVAKAPAKNPLAAYAIRVNKDSGLIEIDPGTTVKTGDATFSVPAA